VVVERRQRRRCASDVVLNGERTRLMLSITSGDDRP